VKKRQTPGLGDTSSPSPSVPTRCAQVHTFARVRGGGARLSPGAGAGWESRARDREGVPGSGFRHLRGAPKLHVENLWIGGGLDHVAVKGLARVVGVLGQEPSEHEQDDLCGKEDLDQEER
jgi:hypothetical protein